MKKRLILLRHGNTGFEDRYIGTKDVPLSSTGMARIVSLESTFQSQKVERIVVSPMLRCRQSAELLFSDRSFSYDDDLREVDFGRWEGLNFSEIVEKDPDLVDKWAAWTPEFCFPQGECIGNFLSRVHDAGVRLAESSDKNILVIAHGGVIRALICYFLKLKASDYLLFQVEMGKYATLNLFREGAVLTGLNLGAQ
ncbi:MAG: histidine phosphatase family protein [Desulfocapsa sp.]|nr:histidine phosphatase family protein [Desulfocapsa sp.]